MFAGASTIRAVRDADAGGDGAAPRAVAGVKRKMSADSSSHGGDGESKENGAGGAGEERPAKKRRRGTAGPRPLRGGRAPPARRAAARAAAGEHPDRRAPELPGPAEAGRLGAALLRRVLALCLEDGAV